MKINEVENFYKNASKQQLREHITSNNDSGINTDVLVSLAEQANDPSIWEDATADQLIAEVRSWGYDVVR